MSGNYFVQLTESGQTVNLAQVASINWQELPEGWEESDCTATITLASGYYVCITPADAQELWEALNRYNTRMGQALAALPQLVRALSQFLEELGQVAGEPVEQHEREPSQPRPAAPPPTQPTPPGQHGNGNNKVRVNPAAPASAGPNQPVAQRQRHAISQ